MTRSNFMRWSYNNQERVVGDTDSFRRHVCENLDDMEAEAGARAVVLAAIGIINAALLSVILWKIW